MTIGLSVAMCVLALILWGSARLACNANYTPERSPAPRPLEELTRDAKNAAYELQVRWAAGDFATAQSLATGSAAELLQADAAKCDSACVADRAARRPNFLTRATLVDQSAGKAIVVVETQNLKDLPSRWVMDMVSVNGKWLAEARRPANPGEAFRRSGGPTTEESPSGEAPPATPASAPAPAPSTSATGEALVGKPGSEATATKTATH